MENDDIAFLQHLQKKTLIFKDILNGVGRSFENRSFENSSKTGQRMDWGPQGFTFSTFYCFPNLT